MAGLGIGALWLAATLHAAPIAPVLLDPLTAAAEVKAHSELPPLLRAEVLLWAADPEGARAVLPTPIEGPRALRLESDALIQQVRGAEAEGALTRLGAYPGWQNHVAHQRAHLETLQWRRHGARAGLMMFALSLALLALGGARELLRVHPESLALLLGGVLVLGLARGAGTVVAAYSALIVACTVTLGHAAVATLRRTRPGLRARLLIGVLLLSGILGAGAALGFQIGPASLLQALVAGAAEGTTGGTSG